jgi:hypothetical protein
LRIGAVKSGSGKQIFAFSCVTEEHLGVLAEVIVEPAQEAVCVLREIAASIRVVLEIHLAENRR